MQSKIVTRRLARTGQILLVFLLVFVAVLTFMAGFMFLETDTKSHITLRISVFSSCIISALFILKKAANFGERTDEYMKEAIGEVE